MRPRKTYICQLTRVKHQIKLNVDNLYHMYIWHETKMNELKDKHNDELLKFMDDQNEKVEKDKKLEISKVKIKYELKIQKLINEHAKSSDDKRIVEQAKELISMMMVGQLCEAKRNTFLYTKPREMGLLDPADFRKINKLLKASDIEDKLLNPIFNFTDKA